MTTVRLPEEWVLENHPPDVMLENAVGRIEKTFEQQPGGFVIRTQFEMAAEYVPVDGYADLAALVRTAGRNYTWNFLLAQVSD